MLGSAAGRLADAAGALLLEAAACGAVLGGGPGAIMNTGWPPKPTKGCGMQGCANVVAGAGAAAAMVRMEGRVSNAVRSDGLRSISEGLFNLTVAARAEHCQGGVCAEHDAVLVDGADHAM